MGREHPAGREVVQEADAVEGSQETGPRERSGHSLLDPALGVAEVAAVDDVVGPRAALLLGDREASPQALNAAQERLGEGVVDHEAVVRERDSPREERGSTAGQ